MQISINNNEIKRVRLKEKELYNMERGCGFLDKELMKIAPFNIPEVSNGFRVQPDLEEEFSNMMCVRIDLEEAGNYKVKVVFGTHQKETRVTLFVERRRCILRNKIIKANEKAIEEFAVNVCDIIPRGQVEPYEDRSLELTFIGENIDIQDIFVEADRKAPTIYIAGDSTVTDQGAEYPYQPEKSYCGWGQMLSMYLKEGIAVSNHAHSGLTTESFKREGHLKIVESYIKKDDWLFIQFGHNDQKNKNLDALGGYANELRDYVSRGRSVGAYPVIVTPVSRNTWNGPDESFNDMLKEYALACKEVGEELSVPVIDLHSKSVKFILDHGMREASKYFYPGDWTHHNDFGGKIMARFVTEEIERLQLPLMQFIKEVRDDLELEEIEKIEVEDSQSLKKQLKQWESGSTWIADVQHTKVNSMLEQLGFKLNKEGEIVVDRNLTRVDFLKELFECVRFKGCNVYGDIYEDIFGDEWYSGIVQAAYDMGMINTKMNQNNRFMPLQEITSGEIYEIVIRVVTILNK